MNVDNDAFRLACGDIVQKGSICRRKPLHAETRAPTAGGSDLAACLDRLQSLQWCALRLPIRVKQRKNFASDGKRSIVNCGGYDPRR